MPALRREVEAVAPGREKYYLADAGIYFARNVDAAANYGPLLENVTYAYLRSRGYDVSAGGDSPP